jgi:N-acetylmuramoyl-L-alanine amidase
MTALFLAVFVASASSTIAASSYASVRMFGTDYVDARDFGRRFGLTATWIDPQKSLRLKSANTSIELTLHSQESTLNGLSVYLSEPVAARDGKLFLSRSDIEDFFTPILTQNSGAARSAVSTVVIDAGHGGNDPGNQNPRLKLDEKTFTLDVARRLERLLKAQGFRTVMTRTSDRAIDLDRRAEISNRARADLFVSIHFNAFSSREISGTETFVMTPYLQRSSPQAEHDDSMPRTRYPANRHDDWNAVLGYQMHRALLAGLKSTDRGLKRFRYSVLRSVECPAVLVEAAFLSNDFEARKVASAAYRQRLAAAIASGVRQYAAVRQPARPHKRGRDAAPRRP